MKIKNGFAIREVAGKTVAISLNRGEGDFQGLITLNSTGKFIWDMLERGVEKEEIYKSLVSDYEITEEQAKRDADAFINKLRDGGVIEE